MILILKKIIRISRINKIASIADFISLRYGNSRFLGAIVTVVCLTGILPYIALQLKAISETFHIVTKTKINSYIFDDTTTYVAIALALFSSYYGTRYADASEKRKGIVTAVAIESILKLLFFVFIASWLFPILILLVKVTSTGPIFYKQKRWGLNNSHINVYKFRTMFYQAPTSRADGSFMQTEEMDNRITSVGRILRKTSLDELPQFLNVLRGDMSVVGPRPHSIPHNLESLNVVSSYTLRHIIKPGITGWAQVNGFRGITKTNLDMQNRVNYDLYYIRKWNFWLDCQIVLQTIINLLKGEDQAY